MARLKNVTYGMGSPLADGVTANGANGTYETSSPFGALPRYRKLGPNAWDAIPVPQVNNRPLYGRAKVRVNTLPSSNRDIVCVFENASGNSRGAICISSTGVVTGHATDHTGAVEATGPTVSAGDILTVEIMSNHNATASQLDSLEWRVNGVSIGTLSVDLSQTGDTDKFIVGPYVNTGAIFEYVDVAVNDDQGSSQNSWPGVNGQFVLSFPISDNLTGGWKDLADSTSNLYDAVNNIPAVGEAASIPAVASVGTVATTPNNATASMDLTPGAPSGIAAGDLLLCFCYFDMGASTTGTITLQSAQGFADLSVDAGAAANSRLFRVYYKAAAGGDTMPTVRFSNATTGTTGGVGQCRVIRVTGANTSSPLGTAGTAGVFTSAQNIGAISGITLNPKQLLFVYGGKNDDWTSVATLSGDGLTWAEQADNPTTNASDQGMVIDSADPPTSPVVVTSKTFTVTGGASATSVGRMFSIQPASRTAKAQIHYDVSPDPVVAATNSGFTTTSSTTFALTLPVVAGQRLIASCGWANNGFTCTVGDTAGNSWSAISNTAAQSASNRIQMYQAVATTTAVITITMTVSSAVGEKIMWVYALDGAAGILNSTATNGTGANPSTSMNITDDGALLIALVHATQNVTGPGGWTNTAQNGNMGSHRTTAGTGTQSVSYTAVASNWSLAFIAIQPETGNYDANATTYINAGVGASDTINLIQLVAVTGSNDATDTSGALSVASNPSQGSEDSFTAFDNGVAGTHPTNWRLVEGSMLYAPSVTKSSSPVIRIGKRTMTSRDAFTSQMALITEFEEPPPPPSGTSMAMVI